MSSICKKWFEENINFSAIQDKLLEFVWKFSVTRRLQYIIFLVEYIFSHKGVVIILVLFSFFLFLKTIMFLDNFKFGQKKKILSRCKVFLNQIAFQSSLTLLTKKTYYFFNDFKCNLNVYSLKLFSSLTDSPIDHKKIYL